MSPVIGGSFVRHTQMIYYLSIYSVTLKKLYGILSNLAKKYKKADSDDSLI